MTKQPWIFSVRCPDLQDASGPIRRAVVGPARAATVEAALHLAELPESVRAEIRTCPIVRDFVEGRLDFERTGYYCHADFSSSSWFVCIGPVHAVLGDL